MSNDDRLRRACDGRLTSELSIFASAGFPTLNPSYDEAEINATRTVHGCKKFSPWPVKNALLGFCKFTSSSSRPLTPWLNTT
jgi:hypothetical protein